MSKIIEKIKSLFSAGKIDFMIGYAEGVAGKVKPYFAAGAEFSDNFIADERCIRNLAVYLNKKEIKSIPKVGIQATMPAIKSILQLAAENQLAEGKVIALVATPQGEILELSTFAEMENFLKNPFPDIAAMARQRIAQIDEMPREARWEYWTKEMANCVRCYACRSVCPLCYCTQCAVEVNKPQWIPVPTHAQGNLEWHMVRAMHLAGRCIGCGECARACPVEIPVGLFSLMLNDFTQETFGQAAGMTAKPDYALGIFKDNDNENFIR
ncbi:MAG: 4Fe-4S binding protein [Chloroflexota bacterium]